MKSMVGPQRGEVTHHQDQFATAPMEASFITRNTKNNRPKKPIPLDVLFPFDIIVVI